MHVIGHVIQGVTVAEKMQWLGGAFGASSAIGVEVPALGTMVASVGQASHTTIIGEDIEGGSRWTITGNPDSRVAGVLQAQFPGAFAAAPGAAKSSHRTGIIVVVIALVVVGLIALGSTQGDNSSSNNGDLVQGSDAGTPTSSGSDGLRFVASQSYCDQAAGEARIYVVFTIENTTSSDKDVDVMARRRYSDGESNDSLMDAMSVTVPANATKTFRGPGFDYNAENHLLIECYLHFSGDSGNEVPVAVT